MTEEFQPITSQEQLNSIIGDRIKRAQESAEKKYEGYLSKEEVSKQVAVYQQQIDEISAAHSKDSETIKTLTAQVKSFETANLKSRVAHEMGLPYGMASRITGETEEDIRKDAQSLKELIGTNKPQAPQATTEPRLTQNPEKAIENAAYRKLLDSIKKD